MPVSPEFEMIAAGKTDVGRVRSRNEDAYRVVPDDGIAVVCDGMGGHAGGDEASATAAAVITRILCGASLDPAQSPAAHDDAERTISGPTTVDPVVQRAVGVVRYAVREANRTLLDANRKRGHAEGRGMGTTVAGVWRVKGTGRLIVFHAGDSRIYRIRGGALRQITRDHSLYQIWLDNGERGPAPPKNVIVRALGTAEDTEAEVAVHVLEPGDLFLICTDGLTGMVADPLIADTIIGLAPTAAAARLVALANDHGGTDNVTVVVTRFGPAD